MSNYIHKSHHVNLLLYHYVYPAKYRSVVFDDSVDAVIIQTCQEISKRYDINVLEVGTDGDHVYFLIQSMTMLSPTEIAITLKSLVAKKVYRRCLWVKYRLWGGNIWSTGYFVSTVGKNGNEHQIKNYVHIQGKEYHRLYRGQLSLFD